PADPYYVEGWNEQMYNDLRQFAVDQGMPANIVNGIVDAPVIKLLRMAQMYNEGQSANVKTVKKNNTITRVIKTSKTMDSSSRGPGGEKAKALGKLRKTGDVDDAAAALFAGFKEYSDNNP